MEQPEDLDRAAQRGLEAGEERAQGVGRVGGGQGEVEALAQRAELGAALRAQRVEGDRRRLVGAAVAMRSGRTSSAGS